MTVIKQKKITHHCKIDIPIHSNRNLKMILIVCLVNPPIHRRFYDYTLI